MIHAIGSSRALVALIFFTNFLRTLSRISDSIDVVDYRNRMLLKGSISGSRLASEKFNITVINATVGQNETGYVVKDYEIIYKYRYIYEQNQTFAMNVTVTSSNAKRGFPVLFVVRQQQGVISWQIPLVQENIYEYDIVSHILCPLRNYLNSAESEEPVKSEQNIYVDVSSSSPYPVGFTLMVQKMKHFIIETNKETSDIRITPSQSQYFEYRFPPDKDTVLIQVTSSDSQCMVVSVQDIKCPIYDLDRNIEFRGLYQTMSRKSGITVRQEDFKEGRFYIVLFLKPTDIDCSGIETIRRGFFHSTYNEGEGNTQKAGNHTRVKYVKVKVTPSITKQDYYEAVFEAIGFFILFYIFSIVISAVYFVRDWRNPSETNLFAKSAQASQSQQSLQNYGAVSSNTVESNKDVGVPNTASVSTANDSDSSLDETDVDMLHDADEEKDVFRTKTFLYVADLAKKKEKKLRKKTKLYSLNLLTIGIFYGVPVIQLVYTYQTVLNVTGNQDICYYNFLCAHPLGVFSDFNHVFSNIGYIMLGLLFLLLVWRRDVLHRRAIDQNCYIEKFYGIPQHYGLFYAMGFALIMEGILSGCYHVCPNYSNFQFDTAFMYVIAGLCMLKIYQTRHPDINAHSHATYLSFAFVVVVGVLGVLNGSLVFWIAFVVVYVLSCLALTAQIYYMGRWKLNFGIFKRMYLTLRNDLVTHFTRPMYMDRLILLVIANVVNWSWAIYGVVILPRDFASYLLAIFITNLLLYVAFYIIMKLRHKERILPPAFAYITLSILTWGAALYFFSQKNTSWQKTPAASRENNHVCRILHFYDDHDIWHFLSSSALFFSFMTLLTLDDDLVYTPRDKIPVF